MEFQSMEHLNIVPPENLPSGCGLGTMLTKQKELNTSVYPKVMMNLAMGTKYAPFNLQEKEKLSKEYLLAIIRECCEALDQINSKAWKEKQIAVNEREFKFELIDIQHFINSMYDIWDMDRDEVLGIFMAKYEENVNRHKGGY